MTPSCSRAYVALNCRWWLRADVQPPREETSEAAADGIALHAAIEGWLRQGDGAVVPTPEAISDAFDAWDDWYAGAGEPDLDPEVALEYDPATGRARRLDRVTHRDYPNLPGRMYGTADAVRVEQGRVFVYDWKLTRIPWDADPAAGRAQLRWLACALAALHGVDEVVCTLVWIRDDRVDPEPWTLDAFDLDVIREEIRESLVPSDRPTPGAWCVRCPAVAVCPAAERALTVSEGPAPIVIASNDEAVAVLERLALADERLDRVRSALRAYADRTPIVLPSGRTWGPVQTQRSSIALDAEAADMVRAEAPGAIELRTSFEAIDRGLKARGLKGKELTAARKDLRARLEQAGAVRTAVTVSYREGK